MGGVDFVNLTIKMKNFVYKDQPSVVIRYGKFIQALISLLIVAFVLFFLIKSINQLHKMAVKNKEKIQDNIEIEVTDEVKVLREIRDLLTLQSSNK
jgi:large conductance mechanosensitive channel